MVPLSFRIGPPLGVAGPTLPPLRLDHARPAISWQTTLPAGPQTITVQLQNTLDLLSPATIAREADYPVFAHGTVYHGARALIEGRRVQPARGPSGDIAGMIFEGYGIAGLSDMPLMSGGTSAMQISDLIAYCARQLAPNLKLGRIANPGQTITHTLNDFLYKDLGQILDQVSKEGDGRGTLYDVVFTNGPTLNFLPRTAPAVPTYDLPIGSWSSWSENERELWGKVWVAWSWNGSSGIAGPAVDLTFTGRYGFPRGTVIQGGQLSQAAALNYGYAYLNAKNMPDTAIEIQQSVGEGEPIDRLQGLRLASGAYRPPWLVKAGEWALVGGRGPYLITQTSFDGHRGTFSCKLGTGLSTQSDLWRSLRQDQAAFRRGVNPLTRASR